MSLGPGRNLISPSAEHTCHHIANVELMTTGLLSNRHLYIYFYLPDKPCPVFPDLSQLGNVFSFLVFIFKLDLLVLFVFELN